jgi:hypothetical protein
VNIHYYLLFYILHTVLCEGVHILLYSCFWFRPGFDNDPVTDVLFLLFIRDDALQNFPHSPLHMPCSFILPTISLLFFPFLVLLTLADKFISHWLGNLPKWMVGKKRRKWKRGKYITETRGRPENTYKKGKSFHYILVSTRLLTSFNQLRTLERSHKPFHFISRWKELRRIANR